VLLAGNLVVDESGLTGESRPIRKTALPKHTDAVFNIHDHSKHTLFAGTRTLQASQGEHDVEALVVETGTFTSKGKLVTHILYPHEMIFKYDEELPIAIGILLLYGAFAVIMVEVCLAINGSEKAWITTFLYAVL
jgi:cation-transporting ATPase 13A2